MRSSADSFSHWEWSRVNMLAASFPPTLAKRPAGLKTNNQSIARRDISATISGGLCASLLYWFMKMFFNRATSYPGATLPIQGRTCVWWNTSPERRRGNGPGRWTSRPNWACEEATPMSCAVSGKPQVSGFDGHRQQTAELCDIFPKYCLRTVNLNGDSVSRCKHWHDETFHAPSLESTVLAV